MDQTRIFFFLSQGLFFPLFPLLLSPPSRFKTTWRLSGTGPKSRVEGWTQNRAYFKHLRLFTPFLLVIHLLWSFWPVSPCLLPLKKVHLSLPHQSSSYTINSTEVIYNIKYITLTVFAPFHSLSSLFSLSRSLYLFVPLLFFQQNVGYKLFVCCVTSVSLCRRRDFGRGESL